MVPILQQALVYDEMKGYMSVGQHIRDAACYMCWAFARAYDPSDLEPFIQRIACGLLVTTVFDREINCRRAASAGKALYVKCMVSDNGSRNSFFLL